MNECDPITIVSEGRRNIASAGITYMSDLRSSAVKGCAVVPVLDEAVLSFQSIMTEPLKTVLDMTRRWASNVLVLT